MALRWEMAALEHARLFEVPLPLDRVLVCGDELDCGNTEDWIAECDVLDGDCKQSEDTKEAKTSVSSGFLEKKSYHGV